MSGLLTFSGLSFLDNLVFIDRSLLVLHIDLWCLWIPSTCPGLGVDGFKASVPKRCYLLYASILIFSCAIVNVSNFLLTSSDILFMNYISFYILCRSLIENMTSGLTLAAIDGDLRIFGTKNDDNGIWNVAAVIIPMPLF